MKRLFFSLAFFFVAFSSFAQDADALLGHWKTGDGKALIQIYKRGDKYVGKIAWMAEPNDPKTGQPKKDSKNDDEALRNRTLLGLEILTGFVYDGDNEWDDGKIYDPQGGDTYSCTIKMPDASTLKVRGYVGISLIGRTDTWKRQAMKESL